MNTDEAFSRFFETIRTLRAPDGCPWDREQTPLSMRLPLIEETFEAVDAVTEEDCPHAAEELGDVILNAFMIAYMYEQHGDFTVADALNGVTDKLIRRHPHVFPQSEGRVCAQGGADSPEAVLNQWDRIKETVEGRKQEKSVLDGVPESFPPLLRAYKMQKKAAKKGFDWEETAQVKEKVLEELREAEEAYAGLLTAVKSCDSASGGGSDAAANSGGATSGGADSNGRAADSAAGGATSGGADADSAAKTAATAGGTAGSTGGANDAGSAGVNPAAYSAAAAVNPAAGNAAAGNAAAKPLSARAPAAVRKAQLHAEEEIGDLLFAVVNYARHMDVDPETALNRANRKFYRRFSFVEQSMRQAGIPMNAATLSAAEQFWEQAKMRGL